MQQARRRILSKLSDAWAAAVAGSGTRACTSGSIASLQSCSAGQLTSPPVPVGRRTLSSPPHAAAAAGGPVCRLDARQQQQTRNVQQLSLLQTADDDQQGAGIGDDLQQPGAAGIPLHGNSGSGSTNTNTQPSLAAAALFAAAVPAEAVTADGFGPVVAAMQIIDGLQAATGLPWWATLSATAVGKLPR